MIRCFFLNKNIQTQRSASSELHRYLKAPRNPVNVWRFKIMPQDKKSCYIRETFVPNLFQADIQTRGNQKNL